MSETTINYSAAQLKSSVDVKWCAGCGAHSVLNSLKKAIPETGVKQEDVAVISGIGCSSRLPYYLNTYGFHSIHGRAAAIATGTKLSNPNLQVWQISGDGDALAIGGNHMIHAVRRNVDINTIVFNNEIYGLTKGQFSPTTKKGAKTKTSPHGHLENPFNVGELVIGCQGRYFARSLDSKPKLSTELFINAAAHKGMSVTEVLMNCVIFNDGAHSNITDKLSKDENQIVLEHGKPMIFGKDKNKGLVFENYEMKIVEIDGVNYKEEDILVHDKTTKNSVIHGALVNMRPPQFPVALGVIREVEDESYDNQLVAQIEEVKAASKIKNTRDLFSKGEVLKIK